MSMADAATEGADYATATISASACSKSCSANAIPCRAFLPEPVPRETIEHV